MKETIDPNVQMSKVEGYFLFVPERHLNKIVWGDGIALADDDGMGFCLDSLRGFEGRYVRITIEAIPDFRTGTTPPEPPHIYKAIGLTVEVAGEERRQRRKHILSDDA